CDAPIVLCRRRDLETESGEDLWADFTWCGRSVHVCVVYIKPSASDDEYMRWFCKVEEFINTLKGFVIILGDLNLNSVSLSIKNYYCYFLSFCGLNERNVVKNMHGGMLDVVLVRESIGAPDIVVTETEGIVPLDAYHPALDIQVRVSSGNCSESIEPSNLDSLKDWNFSKCDFEHLYLLFSKQNIWDEVLLTKDVKEATLKFYNVIYDLFDMCVPKKRRGRSANRRYPIWFTRDIIQDIRAKLKFHSNWKLTKSHTMYLKFSNLRSSLKTRISEAYSLYMTNLENKIKHNPRQFWSHISCLRSKGGFEPKVAYRGQTFSGTKAAEAFAEFFSTVFLPDSPRLNADLAVTSDHSNSSNYINIPPLRRTDIIKGINKLKVHSSVGFVLRNCRDFRTAHAIKVIFNALVRSKLETSSCVWNPHETTYALVLEKVQKAFLRNLYKRLHGYYPYLYPTKFLLVLGYNSLEVRRARNQLAVACKTLRGSIDAPDLLEALSRLYVPDNYCRGKKHRLFAVPSCRTVARAKSPIPRTLAALNGLLDANPTNDLFVDGWKEILSECLKYCEANL
ncbi:hypothetical protein SFRURICE_012754, partial [Spodoptera frugiperda]